MAFGSKAPKPAENRKCPFVQIAGSSSSGCLQAKCAMWQDAVGACAFNVLAQAALEDRT